MLLPMLDLFKGLNKTVEEFSLHIYTKEEIAIPVLTLGGPGNSRMSLKYLGTTSEAQPGYRGSMSNC